MAPWTVVVFCCALASPGETVLLDFHADWCGPCRMMAPIVDRLEASGVPVRRVNIDREQALAAQFKVSQIPCFVMLVDGREVDRVVGATNRDRLEMMASRARSTTSIRNAAVEPRFEPSADATAASGILSEVPSVGAAANAPVRADELESLLKAATVRLEIADGQGHAYGSGTIVDRRGSEALIVTCGHIFRDSQGQVPLKVTLFEGSSPREVTGRVLKFDLEQDVGLVVASGVGSGPSVEVATPEQSFSVGDAVLTSGCDLGREPSIQSTRIKAVNKYLGPANLVIAGEPLVGRSGGGMFSADGKLIGVCNAADPQEHEGLYASLSLVHGLLASAQISLPSQITASGPKLASVTRTQPLKPSPSPDVQPTASIPLVANSAHQQQGEAEVICIVRPRNRALAESEVIVLDSPSEDLLNRLASEGRRQPSPQWTSLQIPASREPSPGGTGSPNHAWRPHRQ